MGYKNDKCLELVPSWRAVRLNNFKASEFALSNKCSWCSHVPIAKHGKQLPLIHKLKKTNILPWDLGSFICGGIEAGHSMGYFLRDQELQGCFFAIAILDIILNFVWVMLWIRVYDFNHMLFSNFIAAWQTQHSANLYHSKSLHNVYLSFPVLFTWSLRIYLALTSHFCHWHFDFNHLDIFYYHRTLKN